MKKVIIMSIMSLILTLPISSLAATYHYLDMKGTVHNITASNANEAMILASAQNDAYNGGVALDVGILKEGKSYGVIYQYINIVGAIKSIVAANERSAYSLINDLRSGPLLVIGVNVGK